MLRFIKHNLTSIDSIEIYPIISLLIFVIFFALVIFYVLRMKPARIHELGSSPLDDSDETIETTED